MCWTSDADMSPHLAKCLPQRTWKEITGSFEIAANIGRIIISNDGFHSEQESMKRDHEIHWNVMT